MIPIVTPERDGLFDVLGRLFYAATQRLEFLALENGALAEAAEMIGPELADPPEPTASEIISHAQTETGLADTTLAGTFRLIQLLVQEAVRVDTGRRLSASEAAAVLIEQLRQGGYYVGGNTVNVSAEADSENLGDAVLYVQQLTEDGRPGAGWIPQTGQIYMENDQIRYITPDFIGPASAQWPTGSGQTGQLQPIRLADGLLANGALQPNGTPMPEWTVLGTSWASVLPPEDEIVFSVQPTGGYFRLEFENRFFQKRLSEDIPYNVSASALQAVICNLDQELDRAEPMVSTRQNDLGFKITWQTGPGNLPLLTVYSYLEGATASITRTGQGAAGAYAGYAVQFIGNSSEKTALFQRVQAGRSYATGLAAVRVYHDGATAGTLQFGLFQEASSTASALPTPAGGENIRTVNLASLEANQFHILLCPLAWTLPLDAYFGVRLTQPIPTGKSLFVNWPQLIPVSAPSFWQPGLVLLEERYGPMDGDRWTWTIQNNLAGKLLTWWFRVFPQTSLLLPQTGTTLIPDTIIAS